MCDADWKILEGSCCISSSSDKDKFKETATASTAVQVTPNINSVSTAEEDVSLLTDSGQLLEKLKGSDDQFSLRGEDNVWILKPAGRAIYQRMSASDNTNFMLLLLLLFPLKVCREVEG